MIAPCTEKHPRSANDKYYHCPHCAFSAGHASYCPHFVAPTTGSAPLDLPGNQHVCLDFKPHPGSAAECGQHDSTGSEQP